MFDRIELIVVASVIRIEPACHKTGLISNIRTRFLLVLRTQYSERCFIYRIRRRSASGPREYGMLLYPDVRRRNRTQLKRLVLSYSPTVSHASYTRRSSDLSGCHMLQQITAAIMAPPIIAFNFAPSDARTVRGKSGHDDHYASIGRGSKHQ